MMAPCCITATGCFFFALYLDCCILQSEDEPAASPQRHGNIQVQKHDKVVPENCIFATSILVREPTFISQEALEARKQGAIR